MSYDIDYKADLGGPYPYTLDSKSPTYNLGPIFRACFGVDGIHLVHGLTGRDAVPIIMVAIAAAYDPARRAELHALEPENGWGDLNGAISTMEWMAGLSAEHPRGIWDTHYGAGLPWGKPAEDPVEPEPEPEWMEKP